MTALSSIEYPYWLIIGGVALVVLGCVGLVAIRQRAAAAEPLADEPLSDVSDEGPHAPEAELNEVERYNRLAKEKRRERWAETPANDEPIDAEAQMGTKGR